MEVFDPQFGVAADHVETEDGAAGAGRIFYFEGGASVQEDVGAVGIGDDFTGNPGAGSRGQAGWRRARFAVLREGRSARGWVVRR